VDPGGRRPIPDRVRQHSVCDCCIVAEVIRCVFVATFHGRAL
jgi:hypothetical protein